MSLLSALGELICQAFFIPTAKTPRAPCCGAVMLDVWQHEPSCPELRKERERLRKERGCAWRGWDPKCAKGDCNGCPLHGHACPYGCQYLPPNAPHGFG